MRIEGEPQTSVCRPRFAGPRSPISRGTLAPGSVAGCGVIEKPDASVVSHADGSLLSAARARVTFARMSSAFFVHTKVVGFSL